MQLNLIQNKIHEIRGPKVMLDFDLAEMYEVETKALKRAVNRNRSRFPADFMFQLTGDEYTSLRYQTGTLEKGQGRGRYAKYFPYAFTEQGVAMLSSVLNSEKAIEVNIAIIRTFVLVRQHALNGKELQDKLLKPEKKYNKNFREIYQALNLLIEDKNIKDAQAAREPIGFKTSAK